MSQVMQTLVDEYNALTGKSVKRFATVEIGQQRLAAAKQKASAPPKPKLKTKAQRKEHLAKTASRTWENEDVATARATRHFVTVNGIEYKSLGKAFEALNIKPIGFIPFRLRLKRDGKATYNHNGKEIHFTAKKKEKGAA